MSAAADRALLSLCIDCAARINHDGSATTVIAAADAMLDWLDHRLAERMTAAAERVKSAGMVDPATGMPLQPARSVHVEISDLLSRDGGGRPR